MRVPRLAEEEKDRWKNAEKIRGDFVRDFSLAQISAMQLDDFVIGKDAENRSLCYRLEREMDDLLPENDARKPHLEAGIKAHTEASMGAVTGSDYMVEHWLAAFAMLYLSGG